MGVLDQYLALAAERAAREGRDPAAIAALRALVEARVAAARAADPSLDAEAAALRVVGSLGDPLDPAEALATLARQPAPRAAAPLAFAAPGAAPPTPPAPAAAPAPAPLRADGALSPARGRMLLDLLLKLRFARTTSTIVLAALLAGGGVGWTLNSTYVPAATPDEALGSAEVLLPQGPLYARESVHLLAAGDHVDLFRAPAEAPRFGWNVTTDGRAGCVIVRLVDPAGRQAYATPSPCTGAHDARTVEGAGEWRVEIRLLAYTGSLSALATPHPPANADEGAGASPAR